MLGSAMLIAHDMDTRLELSPWLAGVFVTPDRRRHGTGSALVQRVIGDATELGVRRLYLYTPERGAILLKSRLVGCRTHRLPRSRCCNNNGS